MPKVRCEYCHEYVEALIYPVHVAQHLKAREDGQQTDYATLPEEERDAGDLSDVPQVYVHRKCGAATGMPEEIIRSYLKNPYMYMADATYCCGCETHVPFRECIWTETGEDLQTYTNRLRAAKPEMKPWWGCMLPAIVIGMGIFGTWAALA